MQSFLFKLRQQPDFYARRVMLWELGLFTLGIAWCFFLPTIDSENIAIILALLTVVSVIINLVLALLLFIKRPKLYLLYAVFLNALPVIIGVCSFMVVMFTSGYYC